MEIHVIDTEDLRLAYSTYNCALTGPLHSCECLKYVTMVSTT